MEIEPSVRTERQWQTAFANLGKREFDQQESYLDLHPKASKIWNDKVDPNSLPADEWTSDQTVRLTDTFAMAS